MLKYYALGYKQPSIYTSTAEVYLTAVNLKTMKSVILHGIQKTL